MKKGINKIFIRTTSAEETKRLGRSLGRCLKKSDAVLLFGNLGAGKTTFVKGIVKGLGGKEDALSPTFILAQTFEGKVPIHHLDFYRLTAREILAMGIEDYLEGKGEISKGVILIEWPERCPELWPDPRLEVHINLVKSKDERSFVFKAKGLKMERLLTRFRK